MDSLDQNVTFFVHHKIMPGMQERYELWLKKIIARAAQFPGQQGVQVVRPTEGGFDYAVFVRWNNIENAKNWAESEDRKQLVAEIQDILQEPDQTEIRPGIEFWFTPPSQKKAPAWKQWLVTTSVIWPLTLIVPPVLSPIIQLPVLGASPIKELLIAMVIVALVTYLIMPVYVKAISKWMFR
jgi:antibiotic biosynthesis monooxygenase (ABM) superfamily enzyme